MRGVFMKIVYTAALVLLSHSLFGMHVRTLAIKAPAAGHKLSPIGYGYKMAPVMVQKRDKFSCSCVKKANKESCDKDNACLDIIKKNAEMLDAAYDYVKNRKEFLQKEEVWPWPEGSLLEERLKSDQVCPNFSFCAYKLKLKLIPVGAGRNIFMRASLFLLPSAFINDIIATAYVPIVCWFLYFHFTSEELMLKAAYLTKMARNNQDDLAHLYNNFVRELHKKSTDRKLLQEKNKEKHNK